MSMQPVITQQMSMQPVITQQMSMQQARMRARK
jgi:hypothetical protein